jgi:hypothetical protein
MPWMGRGQRIYKKCLVLLLLGGFFLLYSSVTFSEIVRDASPPRHLTEKLSNGQLDTSLGTSVQLQVEMEKTSSLADQLINLPRYLQKASIPA